MRRGLGKHAFHQIHAVRGEKVEPRCLRSCVVGARGMWSDRMRSMRLFTPPAVVEEQASEQDDASEGGEPETDGIIQDVEDVRGVELGGVGARTHARMHAHVFTRQATPLDVAHC